MSNMFVPVKRKKTPFTQGYEEAEQVQKLYDSLPEESKIRLNQNFHTNRRELSKASAIIGFFSILSDSPADRKFGENMFGRATSLYFRSN